MRAIPFVVAAVVSLAGFGTAQLAVVPTNLDVTLVDPGLPLVASRPTSLALIVRYEFGPGAVTQGPTEVLLSIEKSPSWMTPVPVPLALSFNIPPERFINGTSVAQTASVNVTLRPEARAGDQGEIVARAEAKPNGNLAGKAASSPPIKLTVAYVGKVAIEFQGFPAQEGAIPGPAIAKGGRWTEIPVVVKNEGNGPSAIALRVASKPELSEARVPAAVTLGVGESQVVTAGVRMPWTESQSGLFEVEATPQAGKDTGPSSKASVLLEGASAAPGFETVALLGVLLLAGFARRNRR